MFLCCIGLWPAALGPCDVAWLSELSWPVAQNAVQLPSSYIIPWLHSSTPDDLNSHMVLSTTRKSRRAALCGAVHTLARHPSSTTPLQASNAAQTNHLWLVAHKCVQRTRVPLPFNFRTRGVHACHAFGHTVPPPPSPFTIRRAAGSPHSELAEPTLQPCLRWNAQRTVLQGQKVPKSPPQLAPQRPRCGPHTTLEPHLFHFSLSLSLSFFSSHR